MAWIIFLIIFHQITGHNTYPHTQFNKVTDSSNLPLEAYFDQTALFLMEGIYQQDFELFGYRLNDPKNANPEREIHLDNLHTALLENPG